MDKKDFSDIMNNMKDLTLGQIFRLVAKLKYKTAIMIVMFIIATLGSAFVAGKYSQQKETAVMLESPFSMRIEVNEKTYDFNNLTLMRDPTMPKLEDDRVALSLREIQGAFDVMPVGQVIARVEENKLTGIWRLIISKNNLLINEANAQPIPVFNWNGHSNDYNFKERFINKNTIHRYYPDGCILEYQVDGNRRSIPSTFRWVKITHGSIG
jgi:hypothetical protein